MSRKTATAIRPPIAGDQSLAERVLAERRGDVGAVDLLEPNGQSAGLQDESQILRLLRRSQTGDLGRVPGDPVRVLLVVDRRPGPDLVVEDDREVLEEWFGARELRRLRLAAHSERPRDVVELLATRARELHDHDRLVRLRVEVLTRAGQLQVVTRHLGDRLLGRRVVLEQVVVAAWSPVRSGVRGRPRPSPSCT